MAPRETENNAYAKFWGDKQRTLWYVMVFLEWSIEGTVQRTPAVCPAVLVAKTRSVPDLPPCTCLKMSDVPGLMSPQLEYFICMTEGQPVCQSSPINRLTVVYHDVTFLS